MNEGVPVMYAGYGGPGLYMVGGGRLEAPEDASPAPATPRRSARRAHSDHTAFGYEESDDDSSLSSNTSSSNKSNEKVGECSQVERVGPGSPAAGAGGYTREWRGRRHQRTRRYPPDRYLNATYPFQVKFAPEDLLNGSKWDTLSQEIWDKFVKSQQTEETFRKKMNLWKYLYVSIKSIFPRYGLYVVGSTMSGFGLESSDMDLCLFVRPVDNIDNIDPRAHALFHLNYILGYIKGFDPGAEVIQAKVPILKFRDARAGVQVDLNCNNVVGIRNTNLLNCFSKLDWRVRPLVAVAKLWARAHHINDARHRTISSYALTLMVIHYLQCGVSPAVLPRGAEAGGAEWWRAGTCRLSLGELFCGLLRYYAMFPYGHAAVSVRAGARLPLAACRAHAQEPHHWRLLCVEEPFNLSNTARSVYDPETFERIVTAFRDSYKRLAGSLRLHDAWPVTDR